MVAFKNPKIEERGAAIRKFAAAAASGHLVVAGPETARKMNKAFKAAGLPYRVEVYDNVDEGIIYAVVVPGGWSASVTP